MAIRNRSCGSASVTGRGIAHPERRTMHDVAVDRHGDRRCGVARADERRLEVPVDTRPPGHRLGVGLADRIRRPLRVRSLHRFRRRLPGTGRRRRRARHRDRARTRGPRCHRRAGRPRPCPPPPCPPPRCRSPSQCRCRSPLRCRCPWEVRSPARRRSWSSTRVHRQLSLAVRATDVDGTVVAAVWFVVDVTGSADPDDGTASSAFAALHEATKSAATSAIEILRSIEDHDGAPQGTRRGTSTRSRRYLDDVTRLNGTSTAVTLVVAGLLGACAGSGSDSDIDQVRPPAPSDVAATIEPTGTEPPAPATGQLGGAAATAAAIEGLLAAGRVDLSPTGNRVIEGPGSLLADEPLIIDARVADTTAVWIAPTGPSDWLVVSSDGSVDIISTVGDEVTVEPLPTAPLDPSLGPPLVTTSAGATLVEGHDVLRSFFADPLPDTRVTTDGYATRRDRRADRPLRPRGPRRRSRRLDHRCRRSRRWRRTPVSTRRPRRVRSRLSDARRHRRRWRADAV